MKKLLLLFTTLLLISCSSDDGNDVNNNENTNVLIKKITEKTYEASSGGNDVTIELNYTYNGNKIVSIEETHTYDGQISTSRDEFTYTDNLITSVYSIYNYSGRVTSRTKEISYDTNGRVTSLWENFEYLSENEVVVGDIECARLLLSNNQISKRYWSEDCQNYELNFEYEYDNKRNALSNIQGYNWAFMWDWLFSGNTEYQSTYNNLLKNPDYTFQYDYNENGYPRNVSFFNYDGSLEGTMVIEYY